MYIVKIDVFLLSPKIDAKRHRLDLDQNLLF